MQMNKYNKQNLKANYIHGAKVMMANWETIKRILRPYAKLYFNNCLQKWLARNQQGKTSYLLIVTVIIQCILLPMDQYMGLEVMENQEEWV